MLILLRLKSHIVDIHICAFYKVEDLAETLIKGMQASLWPKYAYLARQQFVGQC